MRGCRAGGITACHSVANIIAGCIVCDVYIFCIGTIAAAVAGGVEDFTVIVQLIVGSPCGVI